MGLDHVVARAEREHARDELAAGGVARLVRRGRDGTQARELGEDLFFCRGGCCFLRVCVCVMVLVSCREG